MDDVQLYVVIADDDLDDHDLVKDALKECTLNTIVTSVYNGRQLLDLLHKLDFYKNESLNKPDMVLLDMRMPVMNGLEALKLIRSDKEFDSMPVYILSGESDQKMVAEAMKLGATDYFIKPLSYEDLKPIILGMCRRISKVL